MKSLTILCDADDTIQELTVHWLAELNKKYNYNVKKKMLNRGILQRHIPN